MNTTIEGPNPGAGMRRALQLEAITIAWMIVEAGVSLAGAALARSVLLLAFGVDSGVELLSAGVLYWRLHREAHARRGEEAAGERIERRTARFAGCLLYALALYVLVQAGYGLWHQHAAETSWLGMGIAIVAALGMPVLARAKIRVAAAIGSRALRADAVETITCGYLSWVLLAGLAANALFHWWWLDSAAALMLVPFLIKEGREARTGECCGCEHEVGARGGRRGREADAAGAPSGEKQRSPAAEDAQANGAGKPLDSPSNWRV